MSTSRQTGTEWMQPKVTCHKHMMHHIYVLILFSSSFFRILCWNCASHFFWTKNKIPNIFSSTKEQCFFFRVWKNMSESGQKTQPVKIKKKKKITVIWIYWMCVWYLKPKPLQGQSKRSRRKKLWNSRLPQGAIKRNA